MTESADLDRMAKDVRAAAEACGAMVIEAILSVEAPAAVAVHGAAFPCLVKHVRPRLIYVFSTSFDVRTETALIFDVEDELDASLKKFLAKWAAHNGETCRLVLGAMCDGILHGIVETADWLDEFEEEAEALVDETRDAIRDTFDREREDEAKQADAAEKKRLAPHVKKLLADPRFDGPKTSVSKRIAPAELLLPDLDPTTIRKVVDRADNQFWLSSTK